MGKNKKGGHNACISFLVIAPRVLQTHSSSKLQPEAAPLAMVKNILHSSQVSLCEDFYH